MEMIRDARPWKLPVALDKYKSVYRKDYGWHEDYHSPTQAHVPKPSFPPLPDVPKCYLPECRPSDLSTKRAGKLEILAEPIHDLSCCPPLPPPTAVVGTEVALVPKEQPSAPLITYQQFAQDLYRERQNDAAKNRNKVRNTSILMKDFTDPDWKSVYQKDYEGRAGAHVGSYTEETRPSPVFPTDSRFNQSRWITEYGDSYSHFLKKLDWSSPISARWLPFGKNARWTPRYKESTD
ncbi:uncharacterized protein LOC130582780 [Malurus melanocephalus]|uniref:uncharacterized protein LOC130582780 n=1 Tax=Malurus melanocephalus TaxID=175006 RepID=UPI0025492066|nr:uncharacterized protein LOC130582780 [Malurus melanocephalus]